MKLTRVSLGAVLLTVIALVTALAMVSSCRKKTWSKQEADDWYARYGSMVRWVGYQGSDDQSHHFIARVMDDWAFIKIDKGELQIDDEQPFSEASSAPQYYYLVDPGSGFQKIED